MNSPTSERSASEKPYYRIHIFVCINSRVKHRSCAQSGSEALFHYLKERIQALGMHQAGQIRVNRSGCLGRCLSGPAVVVYPQGIWYQLSAKSDVDTFVEQHILKQRVVESLRIPPKHEEGVRPRPTGADKESRA